MKIATACTVCLLLIPYVVIALPAAAIASAKSDQAVVPVYAEAAANEVLDEITADDIKRSKRAGSGGFDIFAGLKEHIASIVTKASASLASGSSGSSSSGSGHSHTDVDVSHFDAHALKKSILNTIYQAVKAITGGITAINGQLIKGSGYAISAGGKLVAASGDAVTNVGKKLALSADLVHPAPSKGTDVHSTLAKLIGSSSSSSSSSSSGLSASGHGHTGYTTYEGATSGGQHYGPTHGSAPSGPTSSGGSQTYLPFEPASGHEQGYQAPAYGGHEVYADVLTDSYQQPLTGLINVKTQAVHSAADALRQILNKLPIDKPESTEYHAPVNTADYVHLDEGASPHGAIDDAHDTPHNQYEIPYDPTPPFRPLKLHSTYDGPPSPPINSITHTQIITTAYGAPISDYQKPITLLDVDSTSTIEKWHDVPIGPGVSQPGIEEAPLDMYHVLSQKHKNQMSQSQESIVQTNEIPPSQPNSSVPTPPPQNLQLPHYSPPAATHPIPHPPGGHSSHEFSLNALGHGYEIHKSIGYEIRSPPQMHYAQRRFVKVRRPGPFYGPRPAGLH